MTKAEFNDAMRFYRPEVVDLERRGCLIEFREDSDGTGVAVADDDQGTTLDLLTPEELGAFFVGVRMGSRQSR
jgi:hypothetical protein